MMMPSVKGYFDILDDFFYDPFFMKSNGPKFNDVMRTDIKEKDDNYIMDIDLPGASKEDINIELNDGYLNVSAKTNKEVSEEDKDMGYVRRERYTGSCQRSYYVGKNVTEDDIKASYKNGILSLVVPKEDKKKVEEKKIITIE